MKVRADLAALELRIDAQAFKPPLTRRDETDLADANGMRAELGSRQDPLGVGKPIVPNFADVIMTVPDELRELQNVGGVTWQGRAADEARGGEGIDGGHSAREKIGRIVIPRGRVEGVRLSIVDCRLPSRQCKVCTPEGIARRASVRGALEASERLWNLESAGCGRHTGSAHQPIDLKSSSVRSNRNDCIKG